MELSSVSDAGRSLEIGTLLEWLRIESVSSDPARARAVAEAAGWADRFLQACGAETSLRPGAHHPFVVGRLRATTSRPGVPTILCYGHFDVQPEGRLDLWNSPPFAPCIRDGWLYGRGTADDKGQLWILLEAARQLVAARCLPVDLLFVCDGEEEIGGKAAPDFIRHLDERCAAGVVFDTAMVDRETPSFNLALRGIALYRVTVKTGQRDLHSGVFGGAALNAAHVVSSLLADLAPVDGVAPEELLVGVAPPSEEEVATWQDLPPASCALAGATPVEDGERDFYTRTWTLPAIDVHGIDCGEAHLQKTIVPAVANAQFSIRLAPGQRVEVVDGIVRDRIRRATPAGAVASVELVASSEPVAFSASSAPIRLARDVFAEALGRTPVLARSGGSLPVVAALAERGIPTLVSGFDVPDGNIHSPNERFLVQHLIDGVEVAKSLFQAYATLEA